MLSENFQRLLDIQMERYQEILRDCRPHLRSNLEHDRRIHTRLVGDIELLVDKTLLFKKAAVAAKDDKAKGEAARSFQQASYISTYLWDYLYKNRDEVSPFRRKALEKYGEWMNTIRMEHITTNVTVAWDRIDKILADDKEENPGILPEPEQPKPRPHLKIVK
ncbi:MAG: hypothetical protein H6867_00125 [Rhodospirillales bacterium]|nr:hypothetical protein [Rhodospirillales bacterium]MCB9996935.1 hypothetical protein [Rhodospirillales bacterium]